MKLSILIYNIVNASIYYQTDSNKLSNEAKQLYSTSSVLHYASNIISIQFHQIQSYRNIIYFGKKVIFGYLYMHSIIFYQ